MRYTNPRESEKLVNNKNFLHLNELSENLFELEMSKSTISLDLPLQIGLFVYQYAKLRMLQFYYDFIDVFISRCDYQYCEMDTDSAYFAISAEYLEGVIKPDKREEFYRNYPKWLPAEACDKHTDDFVKTKCAGQAWEPEECCKARRKYDKRTPGLFKQEWIGDGFIGLCSKTYHCFGETDKTSCKGINKQQNQLTRQNYLDVLREQKAGSGTNRGFRSINNTVYTYSQIRNGLSYFYPKRVVV